MSAIGDTKNNNGFCLATREPEAKRYKKIDNSMTHSHSVPNIKFEPPLPPMKKSPGINDFSQFCFTVQSNGATNGK